MATSTPDAEQPPDEASDATVEADAVAPEVSTGSTDGYPIEAESTEPGVSTGSSEPDSQPALAAVELTAGAGGPLTLSAASGTLTLWPGDDGHGTAELTLALAGRFRPVGGTIQALGVDASPEALRRQVVVARVVDAVEPEERLTVGEYLHSCRVLHGHRHNRLGDQQALDDVGYTGDVHDRIEELAPADGVRVVVAGALLARPVAAVVDRVDRGVGASEWPGLVADLQRAAELTGVAIVASALRSTEEER